MKDQTKKILEENIGEYLHNLKVGYIFLNTKSTNHRGRDC